MPIQIKAPDNSIAEFPDGTPDSVIKTVMSKSFPPQKSFMDKYGRQMAVGTGGIVGGALALPAAGVAAIPTLGLGGLATEATGVGLGASIGGKLYDTAKGFLTKTPPPTLKNQLKTTAQDFATNAIGVPAGQVMGAGIKAIGAPIAKALINSAQKVTQKTPSAAKILSNSGVANLTPGQIMGGALQRMEDAATSIPVAGDFIKSAQRASVEGFNRVALNKVLEPLNQSLPATIKPGRNAISYVQQKVQDAYAPLKDLIITPDSQFINTINKIEKVPIRGSINDELLTAVDSVRQKLKPKMSGTELKEIDSDLATMMRSTPVTPTGIKLKSALGEIRSGIDDLFDRTDPKALGIKKAADMARATLVRIEEGAASLGAKEGVFSPAQLASAIKRKESGSVSAKYAGGKAMMQELSDAANQVLPSTVPDSGTAFRSLMNSNIPSFVTSVISSLPAGAIYNPASIKLINAVYKAASPGAKRQALAALATKAGNDKALRVVYNAIQNDIQDNRK